MLRIEIKPSIYFSVLLGGIALAAFGAIFYAALAWPQRLLLAIVALLYAAHCWRTQMRQRGILQWQSVWFWRGADGIERALRLRRCTVWPGLVVLVFRDIERKQNFAMTLFADSFTRSDDARLLRVHLNHFPIFSSDKVSADNVVD